MEGNMSKALLWVLLLAGPIVGIGCWDPGRSLETSDILKKPSTEWTQAECTALLADRLTNNTLKKDVSVYAYVLPCTPTVLMAYNRRKQHEDHLTESEFSENLDRMTRYCLGMVYDPDSGRFLDNHGNTFHTIQQAGTLFMIVYLDNRIGVENLFNPQIPGLDFNFMQLPDLTDIDRKVYLENDAGEKITPFYVKGRHHPYLYREEELHVLFRCTDDMKHFLQHSTKVNFVLEGFGRPIELPLDLTS
jgi:hypothetical protein